MMKKVFTLALIGLCSIAFAQKPPKLLGICSPQELEKEPYASWYTTNYQAYSVDASATSRLTKLNLKKYTIKVIFGSWCGDSKREVPRFMKLLNAASFPVENLQLIGVQDSLQLYKQSPGHEERGLNVYRVPTFIIYNKNKEVGRITEYPVLSLERDLELLLDKKEYYSNYFSYPAINNWIEQGILTDPNISARGLAGQLKKLVANESELNSCGYVLLMSGRVKESITVFRINVNLFPQSVNCLDSLGEAYVMAGQNDKAIQAYESALHLDPSNENVKKELSKLKGS
jgi:tetratricopeptide (TPR) repeat protein